MALQAVREGGDLADQRAGFEERTRGEGGGGERGGGTGRPDVVKNSNTIPRRLPNHVVMLLPVY